MIYDIVRSMQPFIEANSFFTLPGEETVGYFLVDKDGNGIDCNIYHTKYGKRYEATFFRSTHYEDPKTHKKISCLYYKEILCKHENDTYFNKDGIQVFKKEVKFHTTKLAETKHDIASIYEREKLKSGIRDERFFRTFLLELVIEKEKEYKSKINYKERDPKTLELFYVFKTWLTEKTIMNQNNENCLHKIEDNRIEMFKCGRYPNCDCYRNWEEPASKIDPANAELFVTIMREIQSFLEAADWITFQPLYDKVKSKIEILSQCLHGLLLSKVLGLLNHFSWKMPEKSDLIRFKQFIKIEISASNDLGYYTDKKNIPNQELVNETLEYFQTGAGARVFEALVFLNLLEKQYHFVLNNFKESSKVIQSLKSLPLTELEKHILYGFILKWFGGYPVYNLDEDCDRTLKEIQTEFLRYEGETPEKAFCKVDFEQRKSFMRMGIALTTSINHGVNLTDILAAMEMPEPKTKRYSTFEDLFSDAASNNAIGEVANRQIYLIEQSRYNYEFNVWLQEFKGWEYGNDKQYLEYLTKKTFLEFLTYLKVRDQKRKLDMENEKTSWGIELPKGSNDLTPIDKKPILNQNSVTIVFDVLKGYFNANDRILLKNLLESGNTADQSLVFLGNGNRLTDTFKKLFEHGFITGCLKQDLENWIVRNFKFQPADKIKSFTKDYIQKCISRKDWICKDPIIEIVNGEIQKVASFRKKKW